MGLFADIKKSIKENTKDSQFKKDVARLAGGFKNAGKEIINAFPYEVKRKS